MSSIDRRRGAGAGGEGSAPDLAGSDYVSVWLPGDHAGAERAGALAALLVGLFDSGAVCAIDELFLGCGRMPWGECLLHVSALRGVGVAAFALE